MARYRPFVLLLSVLVLGACGRNNGAVEVAFIDTPEQLFDEGLRLSAGAQHLRAATDAGLVALDKASQWADLPEPPLDDDTREALAVAMPGTASFLERHEWIKHGTCHRGAGGADEYFDDTLALADAINATDVMASGRVPVPMPP